jgi:mevalonate kinase
MKNYPAKLLLFGEYSITLGSNAFAIPYRDLSGKWSYDCKDSDLANKSRQYLIEILDYLKKNEAIIDFPQIDTILFKKDIDRGLWFDSKIPTGYGMGSSGALTAAIYDVYSLDKKKDIHLLKRELAQLENFFHGKSSGIDPLVAYLNEAVLISENEIETIQNLSLDNLDPDSAIFLIDSEKSRKTTTLVESFIIKCKIQSYKDEFLNPLFKIVKDLTEELAKNNIIIFDKIKQLSALQYDYMQEMILEEHRPIWKEGIENDDYHLKLCGAGGGGFVLGFTKNWTKTFQRLSDLKIVKITS